MPWSLDFDCGGVARPTSPGVWYLIWTRDDPRTNTRGAALVGSTAVGLCVRTPGGESCLFKSEIYLVKKT